METTAPSPVAPKLSVVIATYNRPVLLLHLLSQLGRQTVEQGFFEVVVVDDGSTPPVEPQLAPLSTPFHLKLITQPNRGAAAARHAGVLEARGDVVVFLDDDMDIPAHFLRSHYAEHEQADGVVVLGHIRPAPASGRQPVFQRYHSMKIDHLADEFRKSSGPRGIHLYTGNVSLRKVDYLRAGGLDPTLLRSEDVEFGVRLEENGARFVFSPMAFSLHHSDYEDAATWRKEARLYGHIGLQIAHKHPSRGDLHPYRFLRDLHPLALPWLLATLLKPEAGERLATAGLAGASTLDRLRLNGPAMRAAGLVFGLDYFRGVGEEAGSPTSALFEALHYAAATRIQDRGPTDLAKCLLLAGDELTKDYEIALRSVPSYARENGFPVDLVHRVGLQMMTAYRVMQALRRANHLMAAKAISRLIRHVYGADIHWNAELDGGVHIVHGMGMAISGLTKVGAGSVLSQHVTLGSGLHPITRLSGSPQIGRNVHIGPGATLIGPITIGDGSKIMPGAVVLDSVPPKSLVETPRSRIEPRRRHGLSGLRPVDRPVNGARPKDGAP